LLVQGKIFGQCYLITGHENSVWIYTHSEVGTKMGRLGSDPPRIRNSYGVRNENGTLIRDFDYSYYHLNQKLFLGRFGDSREFHRVEILDVDEEADMVSWIVIYFLMKCRSVKIYVLFNSYR